MIETGDSLLILVQTLLDVQTSAEALGLVAAIQQDDADVVVLVDQPLGQVDQVADQAVGQGVVSLGTVQGDLQNVGLDQLEQKILIRGQLSGCRIYRLHDKILHNIIWPLKGPWDLFYLRQPAHTGRLTEATIKKISKFPAKD